MNRLWEIDCSHESCDATDGENLRIRRVFWWSVNESGTILNSRLANEGMRCMLRSMKRTMMFPASSSLRNSGILETKFSTSVSLLQSRSSAENMWHSIGPCEKHFTSTLSCHAKIGEDEVWNLDVVCAYMIPCAARIFRL